MRSALTSVWPRVFLAVVAWGILAPPPARAEQEDAPADTSVDPAPTPAPPTVAPPVDTPPAVEVPAEMLSPRAVLEAFITRMREDKKKAAAKLLNLSNLNTATAESRGPDLAFKLYAAMQRLVKLPAASEGSQPTDFFSILENDAAAYERVPNDPNRTDPWSLDKWTVATERGAKRIVIARNEAKEWQFSKETVSAIDSLYEELESKEVIALPSDGDEPTETFGITLRNTFPPALRKTYFLLPTYQWLLLLALLPVGRVVDLASRRVLTWIGDRLLSRYDPDYEATGDTTARVWRPVGRLANAAVWVLGAYTLDLPVGVTNVLLTALVLVTIVSAVLAVFRVIDLLAGYFVRRAKRRNRRFDDLLAPLAATTIKILVGLGGLIATVAAFNSELPSTLIGGLGIGGIAIALASQETLSNFIGSITLLFDRPFEVGDFVKIEGVEGEIESLGFRSTQIRTALNSQVTMPNSKLAGAVIDNWGRRRYRRYLTKLGLEYGTPPDRIDAFCEGIREIIRRHPHTRKDFYAAYFNEYGAASLDILMVCFFEVPDWATELRERHRLLADIGRLAEAIGVSFAFPTQTLHLHRGGEEGPTPDLPDEDAAKAGARIAAEIAGELPNYQDRPGRVKFAGPTPLD